MRKLNHSEYRCRMLQSESRDESHTGFLLRRDKTNQFQKAGYVNLTGGGGRERDVRERDEDDKVMTDDY